MGGASRSLQAPVAAIPNQIAPLGGAPQGPVRALPHPGLYQLLEDWLSEYPRPNTRTNYRRDLEALFDWCASLGVNPLTIPRRAVNAYRDELIDQQAFSVASVARKLSSCKSFYKYLVEEDVIAGGGPFQHVRKVQRPGDSTTPWLSREELQRVLEAAKRTNTGGRDFVLVALLGLNGLRVSEVISARVENLGKSGGHRTLRVNRKGMKAGVIPLAPLVAEAIDTYLQGRVSGPIIVPVNKHGQVQGARSKPISASAIHRRIKQLAELAKVNPLISAHSFRHTFITLALSDGAPLHLVQSAAGHSNPSTTQRYNRERFNLDSNPTFGLASAMLGGE
jgi:integrase/recombinase XerD